MFPPVSLDVSTAIKTLVLTLDLLGTFVLALSGAGSAHAAAAAAAAARPARDIYRAPVEIGSRVRYNLAALSPGIRYSRTLPPSPGTRDPLVTARRAADMAAREQA